MPYDYAASFELTGRPGNLVQGVINISAEGAFVAVAIGYGFQEDRGRPMFPDPVQGQPAISFPSQDLGPNFPRGVMPAEIHLGEIPPEALISGFRVNPRMDSVFFTPLPPQSAAPSRNGQRAERDFNQVSLPQGLGRDLLQRVKAPEDLAFLFSMVDTSSGRELQDEPAFSLASLGASDGERPFRVLAQPLAFLPRSTVRMQIVERSQEARGTLYVVLYGYKVIGSCGTELEAMRRLAARPQMSPEVSRRIVPFDYVASLRLSGRPSNLIETEVTVNAEGGFVATAIGYGLSVEERDVRAAWNRRSELVRIIEGTPMTELARRWFEVDKLVDLRRFPLRLLPPSALSDGIRIRPEFLRVALRDGGELTPSLPLRLLDLVFERLNRPEDASFRYSIFDGGTGRELQNQPINNIAGLGAASGDRPFKKLARPFVCLPRATIRVTVEEHFGRGVLYIAFQGYKLVGTSLPTGGRVRAEVRP